MCGALFFLLVCAEGDETREKWLFVLSFLSFDCTDEVTRTSGLLLLLTPYSTRFVSFVFVFVRLYQIGRRRNKRDSCWVCMANFTFLPPTSRSFSWIRFCHSGFLVPFLLGKAMMQGLAQISLSENLPSFLSYVSHSAQFLFYEKKGGGRNEAFVGTTSCRRIVAFFFVRDTPTTSLTPLCPLSVRGPAGCMRYEKHKESMSVA